MVSRLVSPSWSHLELNEPHADDVVFTDAQITQLYKALRRYAINGECGCLIDEGATKNALCAYCEARNIIFDLTKEEV